jgi:class 3 adenylate cyclase
MADAPSGTVTLLFTDIEGSTKLLQRSGELYAELLAEHRNMLRVAFDSHDGYEVDTEGDAFFVVFRSANDAAAAAVAAQKALAEHSWPGGNDVRVRMGLHTGEPRLVDRAYVGLDVHRAARVMGPDTAGRSCSRTRPGTKSVMTGPCSISASTASKTSSSPSISFSS